MMILVGIIGFLFVPVVHAETEKSFQPNDFSTYGLGLKDTKMNEAIPEYTPSISYLTKQEATKQNNREFKMVLVQNREFTKLNKRFLMELNFMLLNQRFHG